MGNDLAIPDRTPPPHRPLATGRLIPQDKLDRQRYCPGDFWLGRTFSGKSFGWKDDMNLLTCAGPRAGKGVSVVVPNLLEFPGSTVVVDPKGELATLTARHRRDRLGQKVIVLDPARCADVPDELRGTYNPFDELASHDPYVITAAQVIASSIVTPNPKAREPFWDDSAVDLIQSAILYLLRHYPYDFTLMKLRETVALGDRKGYEEWADGQQKLDPGFETEATGPFDFMIDGMYEMPDFGGVVRETAAKIARMGEQTRGSVLSTAATHLDFVKSPELWDVLKTSGDPGRTFQLKELRRQDRPLTVYLCLPVDMMHRQGRWFRMIIAQMIKFIERTEFDKARDMPILMMIDEFFQLGPMPSIINTLTYSPGFGLRLWLIVQDLNQLKANYPDTWETIIGACGIKQFFGVNDLTTAKYVSELLGEEEIDLPSVTIGTSRTVTESENRSLAAGESRSDTAGWSVSEGGGTSSSRGVGSSSGRSGTIRHPADNVLNPGLPAKGWNTGISRSSGSGSSTSTSIGESGSRTTGTSRTETIGTGTSSASGENRGYTITHQARKLLHPEEVMRAFTRDNLVQLLHVRDHGGCVLFRTPFYDDPFFAPLLQEQL